MPREVEVDGYFYARSRSAGKKLDALVPVYDPFNRSYALKRVPFGKVGYEHYRDRTGLLDPALNHGDAQRRRNFLRRSAAIKDRDGRLTAANPLSANFHARRVLW